MTNSKKNTPTGIENFHVNIYSFQHVNLRELNESFFRETNFQRFGFSLFPKRVPTEVSNLIVHFQRNLSIFPEAKTSLFS